MKLPSPVPARVCAIIALCLAVATLLAGPVWAQRSEEAGVVQGWNHQVNGMPHDWTHHHLVFSNPGTEDEALGKGAYDEWVKIVNDPRYIMQQLQRHAPVQGPAAEDVARIQAAAQLDFALRESTRILPSSMPEFKPKPTLQKDWSEGILTGAVLPNTYPAKYTFNPIGAATCATDYVVYPTGATGSGTAATIIAYNNLYVGTGACEALNPTVYWAYNTGAAAVTTSPVLSGDGTKVAFIQGTAASMSLVVLKFAASGGSVGAPAAAPTTVTNITTCTAPCMTVTSVSGTVGDIYSSPFYDYTNDVIYVGDNSGHLYKITGVFNGTVSPPVTSITLTGSTFNVASPVYDSTSGCVFVGDSEGFFYSVSSGVAGTVCTGASFANFGHSENLGDGAANEGIFDAALVDSSAHMVYAFVTDSAAIGSCAAGDNCIVQFTTSTIASGSTTAAPNAEEALGTGAATDNMYTGTFDNVYYSSSTPSAPSGSIYAIGNIAAAAGGTLYQIPVTSNALGAPVSVVAGLDTSHPGWASPTTEFCNNGASACAVTTGGTCGAGVTCTTSGFDSIYFSMFHSGVGSCSASSGHGCVLAYNVSNPSSITNSGSLGITATASPGCWTTSAFIIDNSSASTGASQVYFVNLDGNTPAGRSTNCATAVTTDTIDATQAAQGTL